jgi:hypothetical protein
MRAPTGLRETLAARARRSSATSQRSFQNGRRALAGQSVKADMVSARSKPAAERAVTLAGGVFRFGSFSERFRPTALRHSSRPSHEQPPTQRGSACSPRSGAGSWRCGSSSWSGGFALDVANKTAGLALTGGSTSARTSRKRARWHAGPTRSDRTATGRITRPARVAAVPAPGGAAAENVGPAGASGAAAMRGGSSSRNCGRLVRRLRRSLTRSGARVV